MSKQASSSLPSGAQTFNAIYQGVSQKVALTSTSALSAVTQSATTIALITSDVACWIMIGPTPTATNTGTSTYLPANVPTYFGVNGGTDKIAGITASTGNLYITEGA